MAKSDWLITATPPTPNGDLHIGHMSGPYLAADIFKRARMALGDNAVYVCYGDDNQSYVVTTADRLGADPTKLMDRANADIQKTLDAYHIHMDQYTRPDDEYRKVVGDAIRLLISKNLVVEKETDQLYNRTTGAPVYEAFASGYCSVCLQETKGGICEACGHPNDPIDLIQKPSSGNVDAQFVKRSAKRLVLPIEEYRKEIVAFYRTKRGVWRPHLLQLVDELLSKPLADYPISHPSSWGIKIGLSEWDGHVINVWAEMGLGLLYLLNRHRSDTEIQQGRYAQFLGYDNSYFFAIVHLVLQFALKRAGVEYTKLPAFIFTNAFYNLENKKFSTSQGHALWARELLEHLSVEEARFYLSLNSPEVSEANFQLSEAKAFARSLRQALEKIESDILPAIAGYHVDISRYSVSRTIENRIKFFCEPEHFSSRAIAQILYSILSFLSSRDLELQKDGVLEPVVGLYGVLKKYSPIFTDIPTRTS